MRELRARPYDITPVTGRGGAYAELTSPNAGWSRLQDFFANMIPQAQAALPPADHPEIDRFVQNMQGTTGYAPRGMVTPSQRIAAPVTDPLTPLNSTSPRQRVIPREMPDEVWNVNIPGSASTSSYGSTEMRANANALPYQAVGMPAMVGLRAARAR